MDIVGGEINTGPIAEGTWYRHKGCGTSSRS